MIWINTTEHSIEYRGHEKLQTQIPGADRGGDLFPPKIIDF